MNNQEVVKSLKNIRDLYPWGEDSYKTLDYAIRAVIELPKRRKEAKRWRAKALEQEPCEDAISRQAVIDQTYLWSKDEFLRVTNPFNYLRKRINDLPSVNPQEPKVGRWVDNPVRKNLCNCSECNGLNNVYSAFCPNCGARMVEPRERSEE